MGDRPNPFPPTSAGAALPTDVIADYPGPAARADAAGRIVAVNPVAAAFLPVGAAWSDVDSRGEPLPQTGSITQFGEPADHIVIQWVAVPLPGGETVLFGIDATLDTNLRRALAESRRRFRDLAELAGDFAWETDRDRGCGRGGPFLTPPADPGRAGLAVDRGWRAGLHGAVGPADLRRDGYLGRGARHRRRHYRAAGARGAFGPFA